MIKPDKTLDIQGLVHPRSNRVIETTMDGLARGQTLRILTNDKGTSEGVHALCSSLGYTLLEVAAGAAGAFSLTIRK